jgi:hypothetical protein
LRDCIPTLQTSIRRIGPIAVLAALVVKIDTIPKPDGLGSPTEAASIEQNSIDFGPHSMMFENRPIPFEF